jgi:hypothetical protein
MYAGMALMRNYRQTLKDLERQRPGAGSFAPLHPPMAPVPVDNPLIALRIVPEAGAMNLRHAGVISTTVVRALAAAAACRAARMPQPGRLDIWEDEGGATQN